MVSCITSLSFEFTLVSDELWKRFLCCVCTEDEAPMEDDEDEKKDKKDTKSEKTEKSGEKKEESKETKEEKMETV